ncbi:MAG: feruloyl-CoA synthase, partial [Fimbriimonadaceae bacterium]|nr:feruloyl-CoA synthase [Alphaproteobacteria bacterium]
GLDVTKIGQYQVDLPEPALNIETRDDGCLILTSPVPLLDYPASLGVHLNRWAAEAPDRIFLAERDATGVWQRVSYADALQKVRAISQYLLDNGLDAKTPVMILSDNSTQSALLQLASMHVGVPVTPVSPAYSLMSQDFEKLKYIFDIILPKLIFAADGARFAPAIANLNTDGITIAAFSNAEAISGAVTFEALTSTNATSAVEKAQAKINPDTVAKILFTSGSTGMPKGVINTQRMLCSNQQTIAQLWPFLEARPPVLVDWLPWSHTFGGNHDFNIILRNGGTLYIDHGKPVPGLIEKTIENVRDVSPTLYFNVPRGYDMIIPRLEQDGDLCAAFFKNLDIVFYAGAALPQNLWERLEKLSMATLGRKVLMASSWGATETAPMITSVYYPSEFAGNIGLPAPGNAVKMVPSAGKMEMRVKGPNITPGYYKDPEGTAEAFDEDGFYIIGDAGRFADPDDPLKGLMFDGRTAENFKLMTGVWVHVGNLRIAAIAAGAPVIQDAAVTGHDRDEIGLLIFPNPAGCASFCGTPADTPVADLIANERVRKCIADGLAAYNKEYPASSTRISRALLMTEPPNIDANEITDKGYLNQRAILARRADLIEKLYSDDPEIIRIS